MKKINDETIKKYQCKMWDPFYHSCLTFRADSMYSGIGCILYRNKVYNSTVCIEGIFTIDWTQYMIHKHLLEKECIEITNNG